MDGDSGISLVEILVAMMIFAMISIAVAYSLTLSLTMSSDARQRVVAANLAAGEVDLLRSVTDVFSILDKTSTVTVDGDSYSVVRSTNWFTGGGADASCGAGGGTLQYKRVNIAVTWQGMRSTTAPVQSDTILAPDGRINDPSLGSILVAVLNSSGTGSAGVSVTATPSSVTGNTAAALTVAPLATDAQGCSYILKVAPGTYDVKVSKSGYVDTMQSVGSSVRTVAVAAGSAASAGFQFDLAGKYDVTYAPNYSASPAIIKPTNLEMTYLNTYGTFYTSASVNPAPLHPFSAGYVAIPGHYVDPSVPSGGCKSVDPEAWPVRTVGTTTYVGQRVPLKAVLPGDTIGLQAPMGVATLKLKSVGGTYLNAVSQASAPGTEDPGCAVGMKYTFGAVLSTSTVLTHALALPYGSWKLYSANSATGTNNLIGTAAVTLTGQGTLTSSTGIVTFDPREAVAP